MSCASNGGGGGISIAANAKKVVVDNRISLRNYYRIADNLLRQADIYREEKNIIDLYIMLLRFSSLVTETIPRHREYHASFVQERKSFKKKNLGALNELESIKPAVQRLVDESNLSRNRVSRWGQGCTQDISLEWPPVTKQNFPRLEKRQLQMSRSSGYEPQDSLSRSPQIYQNGLSQPRPTEERFRKTSLSIPRAKEDTLSRHSILGPNGLHGQWQPPRADKGVRYPINLDLTPIEFPSQEPSKQDEPALVKDAGDSAAKKSALDEVLSLHTEEPCSVVTSSVTETPDKLDIIRQPSPPPVLADVQGLIAGASPQVSDSVLRQSNSLEDEILRTESPLEVHISTSMMDMFMRLAISNTNRNLETCGVLAGSLKSRKFYVTALIIPKQESTSDSCQTTNEEEIFDYQDKESLFPLGWIHTHPTQSCFMSSIDVHTHYSYQIMLPEAIAIVMAPTDPSRKHGIFRLTTPGGMSVIRHCNQRGFHPHEQPKDGSPIYDRCTDVYMNPKLKFDVVDFR